jgi:hypothetical protein
VLLDDRNPIKTPITVPGDAAACKEQPNARIGHPTPDLGPDFPGGVKCSLVHFSGLFSAINRPQRVSG